MMLSEDFLWGGGTAANQIEGGWQKNSLVDSISDHLTQGNQKLKRKFTLNLDQKKYFYPSHLGIDFYHKYDNDIKLFRHLGLKAFRMSITWSRIFPTGEEEKPSSEGLAYYDKVFNALAKAGIKPIVTLYHFDMPINLVTKYQGFSNRHVVDLFVKFAKTVIQRYHDRVKYWITFNEINFATLPSGNLENLGIYNPKTADYTDPIDNMQKRFQALHNVFVASAKTVILAHKIDSSLLVGCMISHITLYPFTSSPEDQVETLKKDHILNDFCGDVQVFGKYPFYIWDYFKKYDIHLKISKNDKKILYQGKVDYYTFSYYMSNCISTRSHHEVTSGNLMGGVKNPYLKTSDWGWQIDPEGLYYTLFKVYDRYHLPILIAENGIGAIDKVKNGKIHDNYRIDYLRDHIKYMLKAVEDGIKLIGYMVWSPIDIVSSSTGEMKKRYGLIYVDLKSNGEGTLKRIPKDSFYWYKKVIQSNGKDLS